MATLERGTAGLSLLAAGGAPPAPPLGPAAGGRLRAAPPLSPPPARGAYAVCWLLAATPFAAPFAHGWLGLFSAEPQGSVAQLLEGLLFSAVASWFAALVFVPIYNLVARADRVI